MYHRSICRVTLYDIVTWSFGSIIPSILQEASERGLSFGASMSRADMEDKN